MTTDTNGKNVDVQKISFTLCLFEIFRLEKVGMGAVVWNLITTSNIYHAILIYSFSYIDYLKCKIHNVFMVMCHIADKPFKQYLERSLS